MVDFTIFEVDLDTQRPNPNDNTKVLRGDPPRTAFSKYNDLLLALQGSVKHIGNEAPDPMVPFMEWTDTSVSPPVERYRNADNTAWLLQNPLATSASPGWMSAADKVKLDAAQSNAYLLNRANHTGTQLANTISNFAAAALTEMQKYGIGAATGPTVSDLNALRNAGMYVATVASSTASGLPLALGHTIIHASGSTGSAMQFASPITTGAGNRWRLWHRQMVADGWSTWSEFAFTGAANTWTSQQSFQDSTNQPIRILTSTGNECGLIKPALTVGSLSIQSKSSSADAVTLDIDGEANKAMDIRLGRATNVGAGLARLIGFAHDGTGTNHFMVDFKTGGLKAKGAYDTTTTLTPNVYVDSAGNFKRSTSNGTVYEEGVFTPTLVTTGTAGNITYGSRGGTYTRIGDRVFWSLLLTLADLGGTVGGLRIGGLPYIVTGGTASNGGAAVGYFAGMAVSNITNIFVMPVSSASELALYKTTTTAATGAATLVHTDVSNTFQIRVSGFYKAL